MCTSKNTQVMMSRYIYIYILYCVKQKLPQFEHRSFNVFKVPCIHLMPNTPYYTQQNHPPYFLGWTTFTHNALASQQIQHPSRHNPVYPKQRKNVTP